jgi:hypothetical protein
MCGKETTKESAIGGPGREIGKIVSLKKEKQVNCPEARSKRVEVSSFIRQANLSSPYPNGLPI